MYDALFIIRPDKGGWVVNPPQRLNIPTPIPLTRSKVEAIAAAREVARPVAPAVIEVYSEHGNLDERIYI